MITGYSTVSTVVLWLMLEYFYFCYLIRIVVFIKRYRSLYCCTVLSGKDSLQILLLCCDRTDTFLVTEFFLTTTIVMGVRFLGLYFCWLNYQKDLHVLRCFVCCSFIPCGLTCSTTWIWVPSPGCWHCFDTLFYTDFVHRVVTTVRALG